VPHALSINQKSENVSYSKLLLVALMEQKVSLFQRIITGDEWWFFLGHPSDSVWAASRDELPQRIKQKIDTEKCLVSILWSVKGIHTLLNVPKGTMSNTAFFTDAVMPSLIENVQSPTRRKVLKGWLIHMHKACPHNSRRAQRCMKASRTERLRDPDYSPDLAPSNFIFRYVKEKLSNYNCEGQEHFLNAITEIFTGADQEVLLSVSESRTNRLKWVIKHDEKYYTK
jgi:histone-lysine N-methyltransferase SETMAR